MLAPETLLLLWKWSYFNIYFRAAYLYIPGMLSNMKNDYVQVLELTEVIHFNLIVVMERKKH